MKRIYFLRAGSYTDPKTGKTISWGDGYPSDGASGPAIDIASEAWPRHDVACDRGRWDDGTLMTAQDCSRILGDSLRNEGRVIRSFLWYWTTLAHTKMRGIGKNPNSPLWPEMVSGSPHYVTDEEFDRYMGNLVRTHTIAQRYRRQKRLLAVWWRDLWYLEQEPFDGDDDDFPDCGGFAGA